MTFIFYDLETSGIQKGFDQILQFAGLRTDDDLNVLGDPFEIRSRLMPHVIPSPGAMRVTGMSIDQLTDLARPSHYEMMTAVRHALEAWCPSVFVGYNSLRFDEEFLRQAFYQCLYPPYLTNTGGSGRADALHLMRFVALIDPNVLKVPIAESGKPTFRLERLAPANGLSHLNAHDALADVQAMIAMCRLVRERRPDLWSGFARFAHKAAVQAFLDEHQSFVLLESVGATGRAAPVVKLGVGAQPAVVYGLDLRCDLDDLSGLDEPTLSKRLAASPRPVRRIKTNAAPGLLPLADAPDRLLGGYGPDELRDRGRRVREDHGLVARLLRAMGDAETKYPPSAHVEQQLYEGGFWGRADEQRMTAFHMAPWPTRAELALEFEDRRLRALARRLIYFEAPEALRADERAGMERAIAKRILSDDEASPWMTAPAALRELDEMMAADSAVVASELLGGYRAHLHARLRNLTGEGH